jgi:hypothetical protein
VGRDSAISLVCGIGGHKLQKSLGQVAFEQYFPEREWSSMSGFGGVQEKWEAVAQAVVEAAGKPVLTFEPVESKYPIVAVEAVDWAFQAAQVDISHDFDVTHGLVVGFLVKETDDFISLTQQLFDNDDVRATMSIPKCTIKRRVDLGNPLGE